MVLYSVMVMGYWDGDSASVMVMVLVRDGTNKDSHKQPHPLSLIILQVTF